MRFVSGHASSGMPLDCIARDGLKGAAYCMRFRRSKKTSPCRVIGGRAEAMPGYESSFSRGPLPANPKVCPAGRGSFILVLLGGSNSVVECDLAKVEVAGSNPVSRSSF
jgi:hypothetical protein